jgi:hypothetical protein
LNETFPNSSNKNGKIIYKKSKVDLNKFDVFFKFHKRKQKKKREKKKEKE